MQPWYPNAMSLHRATEPDWQSIPQPDRSMLQRIAANSHGLITVGNIITAIGFVMVAVGFLCILQAQLFVGVLLITIGRIADLLDGYVADKTQTKSPVGEAFDAGIDKLELAIAVPILLVTPYANTLLVVFLLIHLLLNVLLFVIAQRRHQRIHPTRAGKLSTATAWIAAGLFVLSNVAMADWLHMVIYGTAVICAFVFVTLAFVSAYQYLKQLHGRVEI